MASDGAFGFSDPGVHQQADDESIETQNLPALSVWVHVSRSSRSVGSTTYAKIKIKTIDTKILDS